MKKNLIKLSAIALSSILILSFSPLRSKAQIISTVAGTGTVGHSGDGSAATSATLNYPSGVAFDASGNMYVSEFSGNYIRKISTAGVISTICGTGTASSSGDGSAATSATVNNPAGIAFDASGNMYIAEASGNRIRKINTSGVISTICGTGTASSTGDGSAATSATINFPTDIAIDVDGNIYIAENGGNYVRKIDATSGDISTICGSGTASSTGDGSAASAATINNPSSLAIDSDGNLYIAENGGHRVRMINTSGDISTYAGTGTASSTGDGSAATSATIKYPRGLAFDAADNLYIAEESGSRIRKVNAVSGNISTVAGTGTYSYSGDGAAATSATIKTPFGLSVYSGNLYITDFNSYVVRKICNAPQPAVSPVTYCQGVSATALTATGTDLLWYSAATGGSGSATAPTPSTSLVGTVSYYVSQTPTTFGCESPRIEIVVTVNPTPAAPTVTTPVTYCEGTSAVALTATKATSSDTLYWYTAATGGTGDLAAPTPSTATGGTTIYYVSSTTALSCEGPRAAISVVVNDTPSAPVVVTPVTYCQGIASVALTATKPSPTDNLYWYTAATGGTGSTTAPTPSTATVGSFNHYVSAKSTLGCEGARSLITVDVNATPVAPTVSSPINYCFGVTASALTATAADASHTLYWYTVASGGTGSTTAPTPSTTTVGKTVYYVSAKTTLGCEGPRDSIVVKVNAIPAAPTVTSPWNLCIGATAAALTASSDSLTDVFYWYNSAIGGTGSTTAPTPSTTSLGTTNYYVSAKSSFGCEGPRSLITAVVNPLADVPTVTTPISYCLNATAIALTGTAAASSDTLYWYNVATGGTGSATAPTPSTTTEGSTDYYVVGRTEFGCEGSRVKLTVKINPLGVTPTVVSPINYCKDASAVMLTATAASASDTLYWYNVATGGIGSTTAPTPSTATADTTLYFVSAKSEFGCEGLRDTISVITNPLPTTPTVTSPITYCQNATAAALTATAASATDTLYWYTSATGGTGSITPITPATAAADTITYYVGAKNEFGCESFRDSIQVNIIPAPAAPTVVTPLNICIGAPTSPLTASGINLTWYDAATGGTAVTTAPTPSSASTGSTSYYVTQTSASIDGGCESPRSELIVNINPLGATPTVVSPINYCKDASAVMLTATAASAADTLYWYNVATGGTGSTTAPTPSTATVDTTLYFVSAKNEFGCEGLRDTISVITNPLPTTPTVTSPITYCQGATATALTATTASATDTLYWYTSATGGTGSITPIIPATATADTITYYVSAKNEFGCESFRDSIQVNIIPAPDAPTVVTPLNICIGAPTSPLTAVGINLTWYDVATGGTGSTTAPTPSSASTGSTYYYVTQTAASIDGGCESPRSSLRVIIRPNPAPPTVVDTLNLCESAIADKLTATTATASDTLFWYTAATGGIGDTASPTPSTATLGSTTFYVSAKTKFGCEGLRDSIVVRVNAIPAAATVSTPVVYCQYISAAALTATGTNILWYTAATGGTGSSTAITPSTATSGSTDYYVTQTSDDSVGACESPRTAITVTVNPAPAKPTVSTPINLCEGGPASALSATGINLQWYDVATGGTAVTTAPTPSTATAGSTSYYVTQTSIPADGSCESPRAKIVVKVNALPAAPTVTTPINLCEGSAGTTLTAVGSDLLWYSAATGGTGSTTAPSVTTTTAASTSYFVTQSLDASLGACESPRAEIVVNVNALPAAPAITTPVNLCIGGAAAPLTATGSSLLWYDAFTGGTSSVTAPTPSTTTLGTTYYYVSQTSAPSMGSCEGPRAEIEVVVNPLPTISITSLSGTGLFFCKGKSILLSAIAPSAISYQWSTLGTEVSGATASTYAVGTTGLSGVTVTDVYGCTAYDEIYVQEDTSEKSTISPTAITICAGTPILLTCNPGFTSYTFDWQKEGISIVPATPTANSKVVTASGKYRVIVTNSVGCLDTTGDAIVTFYPGPTKPIITNSYPVLQIPSVYSTYQWYKDGAKIIGAKGFIYYASATGIGNYYVEVTDANGCTNLSDTVTITRDNGIENIPTKSDLKVYPNPTNGNVYVDAPIAINLNVSDMTGRVVLEAKNATNVDLSNLADGTYFLRISDTENRLISVEKITKQGNR